MVRVEGHLVFNIALRLNVAVARLDLAYLPKDQAEAHIAKGMLIRVLFDWCFDFLANTSTIRAGDNHRRTLHCWPTRCAAEIVNRR
jgi:hypothetical protein